MEKACPRASGDISFFPSHLRSEWERNFSRGCRNISWSSDNRATHVADSNNESNGNKNKSRPLAPRRQFRAANRRQTCPFCAEVQAQLSANSAPPFNVNGWVYRAPLCGASLLFQVEAWQEVARQSGETPQAPGLPSADKLLHESTAWGCCGASRVQTFRACRIRFWAKTPFEIQSVYAFSDITGRDGREASPGSCG